MKKFSAIAVSFLALIFSLNAYAQDMEIGYPYMRIHEDLSERFDKCIRNFIHGMTEQRQISEVEARIIVDKSMDEIKQKFYEGVYAPLISKIKGKIAKLIKVGYVKSCTDISDKDSYDIDFLCVLADELVEENE